MNPTTTVNPNDILYGVYGTWPRFRFAEKDIGHKWEVVAAVDDESLSRDGYRLAGQVRDASDLTPEQQAELFALLEKRNLKPEEDFRLSTLLECCPFIVNVPPIDVDPQDAKPEEVIAFAKAFDDEWRKEDLGTIQWFSTGGRGLHGHLAVPTGIRSAFLMRAYGSLVRKVARNANLPLLSDFRSKEGRPPILIDDTLYDRDATGRGGLWRISGAPHSKTGKLKVLCEALPHDAPTFTDACFKRIDQSLEHQEERDSTGKPTKRKPREASGAKTIKPISELQKRRLLDNTAKIIVKYLPPSGARHDFRKSLAGWLLREGVPVRVAAATIAVAGDPQDALATCKTTLQRLVAGRPVFGFKKLGIIVGSGATMELTAALHRDFKESGAKRDVKLGALPTDNDRSILREAARIADAKGLHTRAKGFRRAARCGIAEQDAVCKCCGKHTYCRHMFSDRASCPHCAQRRSTSIINWCMTKWPNRLWVMTLRLPDDAKDTATKARKTWTRKIPRDLRTHIRWVIGPGWVAALTADQVAGSTIMSWSRTSDWKTVEDGLPNAQTRTGVITALLPIVNARGHHLIEYLASADPEGLAADAWGDKVMEATGGKEARALMPWPKKRELRLMAINASRVRNDQEPLAPGATFPRLAEQIMERTACCQARQVHRIRDAKTKEIIATRDDRPWNFAEASVRAENGWRNEKLEFDESGILIKQVLPVGWDETKLRE